MSFARRNAGLLVLAAVAFVLVVVRARTQSIIIDEADSYLAFAAGPPESVFLPSSGNHLLNTILERFVTFTFGVSELTVRTPAILGAALYLSAALYLCQLLLPGRMLSALVYLCLVFNPFVLDYLVAARGYALAIGCLLVAVAAISWVLVRRPDRGRKELACAVASVFIALSIASNFSFGLVGVVTLGSLLLWVLLYGRGQRLRNSMATVLPGLIVGTALCGRTILHWPRSELTFGSRSLAEMWSGLVMASFFQLPEAVQGRYPLLVSTQVQESLVIAAVLFGAICVVQALRDRGSRESRLLVLAGFLGFVLAATLLLHFAAFELFGLPLPKDRTALFFVPLSVLLLGLLISLQKPGLAGIGKAVLLLHAVYFLGCLRLGYFMEWRYNSDSRAIYRKLVELAPLCGTRDAVIEWRYAGVLKFYRKAFGNSPFDEFRYGATKVAEFPADRTIYVLYGIDSGEFIRKLHLDTVYFNPETNATIAIRDCPSR